MCSIWFFKVTVTVAGSWCVAVLDVFVFAGAEAPCYTVAIVFICGMDFSSFCRLVRLRTEATEFVFLL
jgi:hypothetical protein